MFFPRIDQSVEGPKNHPFVLFGIGKDCTLRNYMRIKDIQHMHTGLSRLQEGSGPSPMALQEMYDRKNEEKEAIRQQLQNIKLKGNEATIPIAVACKNPGVPGIPNSSVLKPAGMSSDIWKLHKNTRHCYFSETRDDNEVEVEDTVDEEDTDAMAGIPTLPSRPGILKEPSDNEGVEDSVDLVFDDSAALNSNSSVAEELSSRTNVNSTGPSVELHFEDSEEVSSMSMSTA